MENLKEVEIPADVKEKLEKAREENLRQIAEETEKLQAEEKLQVEKTLQAENGQVDSEIKQPDQEKMDTSSSTLTEKQTHDKPQNS